MATLPELEKKGVFGTTVFKKKGVGWPQGSDAKQVLRHMQQKPVGYQAVRRATSIKYPNTNLWLAAMADSKHTSIMANTWSTTLQAAKRKRRVGGELIEIDYSTYMHWYYFGCHAVDDNNNNRQGHLSFEEAFTPHSLDLCQLGFIVALSQVNSLLAYNFFNRSKLTKPLFSKGEFTRKIAEELIYNEDEDSDDEGYKPPSLRPLRKLPAGAHFFKLDESVHPSHRFCRTDPYHGKFNGEEFP